MGAMIEKLKARQQHAEQDFLSLAVKIAAGETVEDDTAFTILSAAGKTAEQLEAEVDRLHSIEQLKTRIAETEQAVAELEKSQADLPNISALLVAWREEELRIKRLAAEHDNHIQGVFVQEQLLAGLRADLARLETPPAPPPPPTPPQWPGPHSGSDIADVGLHG